MILKFAVVLGVLAVGYACIRLLFQSERALDETEGLPFDSVTDMDLPRSRLIKTIDELRRENKDLQEKIRTLEQKGT